MPVGRRSARLHVDEDDDGAIQRTDQAAPTDLVRTLGENEVIDIITGRPVPKKGNEEVRQRIAAAVVRSPRPRCA
jgi:hypothetical protein